MAQAVVYFNGFETGDASELSLIGGSTTIQSTVVRSGAWAAKDAANTGLRPILTGVSATQWVCRYYYQVESLPGSTANILKENRASTDRLFLNLKANGNLEVQDAGSTLGLTTTAGTVVFSTGVFHTICVALDLAAGGIVKVWVDGVLDISTTHTSDVSATPFSSMSLLGATSINSYFDDIRIDTGGVAQIIDGRCIARQGKTATPTYNAWTKNGAATAALCWSDTPFATATNCSNAVSAAAQTMAISAFSAIQTGHGAETIGVLDIVNACKAALIGKAALSSTGNIRRRVNGTDTDTAISWGTADGYFDSGVWTTTTANLDLLEAGAVHALDVNVETVEDVWVMVDFTELPLPQGIM